MVKIGITGQSGFIGTHLYNTLGLYPEKFERILFLNSFFQDEQLLNKFVSQCDVIVHLAAINRHNDPEILLQTNIRLVNQLIVSCEKTNSKPHILFSSSTQEERDNLYGRSKKESRELLEQWASKSKAIFTGLVIPNVFGPFGKPYYNSVIATFSHQIARNETPQVQVDGKLKLIYIGELINEIINKIEKKSYESVYLVPHTKELKVSEILSLLETYKLVYLENREMPVLKNTFELNLFNTFRCYMDIGNYFPVKLIQHTDNRGSFVEVTRLGIGGQVSFSTTLPGITRGNHYHTRKIERFTVVKGKALIQLRRIGTNELFDFYLDGNEPAYVDMPVWYTHNIKNIGNEELFTIFWINEPYNPENSDTYFEQV